MSLEAVFHGRQWRVVADYEVDGAWVGVILVPMAGGDQLPVEFGEPGLWVDPTDEQWAAASGNVIPVDPELADEVRYWMVRIYGEDRVRLEEGEWVFIDAPAEVVESFDLDGVNVRVSGSAEGYLRIAGRLP